MAARTKKTSPGTRLLIGASVLDTARTIDTRLVRERLQRFEQAHRSYVSAQRRVDAAASQIEALQARLAQLETVGDDAIEQHACELTADHQPRKTPFEAYGGPPPGTLIHLPCAQKTAAVHHIVAVLRSKGATEAVTRAADAADKVATDMDAASLSLTKLQESARKARRLRDGVGQTWEATLAALRRDAQAAAEEGAPDLFTALFPPPVKPTGKTKPAEESATEAPATTPTTGPMTTPNAA
jgi:hypothetical protein